MKYLLLIISIVFISCQTKTNCKVNQDNKNSEIYNEEEAICFISLNLNDKTIELNQIETALLIEFDYMKKIGLVSGNKLNQNSSKSGIELDISKVIEIALKNKKINISKKNLIDIYEAENKYLEFLGLVE